MERPGPAREKPCCVQKHRVVTVRPDPCLRCARRGWSPILRSERDTPMRSPPMFPQRSSEPCTRYRPVGCRSSWRHDEGWQRVTWRAAVNHENRHKGLLALHDRDDASRLPADLMPRLPRIQFRLQEATHPGSADAPGYRLHPLKDGRARLWFPRSYTNRSNSSAQQRPKGTVGVSCEPASVAQDDPSVCITIAVLSYGRRCLVVYLNLAN